MAPVHYPSPEEKTYPTKHFFSFLDRIPPKRLTALTIIIESAHQVSRTSMGSCRGCRWTANELKYRSNARWCPRLSESISLVM